MTCPPEIVPILAEILRTGLLKIKSGGLTIGQAIIEADHLHNLPGLLTDFHSAGLVHYWDITRAGYLSEADPSGIGAGLRIPGRGRSLAFWQFGIK